MQNGAKTTKTKSSTKTTVTIRSVLSALSYGAVFCIGIAFVLQFVFQKFGGGVRVANAFEVVAQCLAYFVVSINAFYYAKTKRNAAYLICWAIAVTLIVVFIIL